MHFLDLTTSRFRKPLGGLSSEAKISFTSDGFRILDQAGGLVTLHWKEIREIVAYKEDLFGYDEICLAFRITDSDDYIRLGESCAEYPALLKRLETHFPDLRTDWFLEVAFPAFVPNWTTIWRRPQEQMQT